MRGEILGLIQWVCRCWRGNPKSGDLQSVGHFVTRCEGPRIGGCEVARRCIFNFWIPSVSSDRPFRVEKWVAMDCSNRDLNIFLLRWMPWRPQKPAGKSENLELLENRLVCDFCGQVVCYGLFSTQEDVPSGKHTKSYWKLPFIVDLPIKNGDFP